MGTRAKAPSVTELGRLLPELRTPVPGPASRELARRLRAVESRNVTFVDARLPVFWEEARGANVVDADGNVYLDLTGAFGVAFAGHAHPLVVRAVEAQAHRLVHGMGDVHPPVVKLDLLERLAELSPWNETRGFLAPSGSEAVEAALKTGALASGRPGILAFEGGYHGLTMGALAVTHRPHFRDSFRTRLFAGVAFAPFPTTEAAPSLARVEQLLAAGAPDGSEIGTVILEPIQGRAGVRIPPAGFLESVVTLAHAAGCVVIMDEIFTGFGRTGSLLASPAGDHAPDVLCVGKALGGGLPLGVCLARGDVMDAWPSSAGEAIHTSTFLGNPLAAAAALGFLDALEGEGLLDRARELGRVLIEGLRRSLEDVEGVREIRGEGLMIAVDLEDAAGAPLKGAGAHVMAEALCRGLLVLPAGAQGNVVEVIAPAILTDHQASFGVETLAACVRDVLSDTAR